VSFCSRSSKPANEVDLEQYFEKDPEVVRDKRDDKYLEKEGDERDERDATLISGFAREKRAVEKQCAPKFSSAVEVVYESDGTCKCFCDKGPFLCASQCLCLTAIKSYDWLRHSNYVTTVCVTVCNYK
jgi:hypothetical protein